VGGGGDGGGGGGDGGGGGGGGRYNGLLTATVFWNTWVNTCEDCVRSNTSFAALRTTENSQSASKLLVCSRCRRPGLPVTSHLRLTTWMSLVATPVAADTACLPASTNRAT
jgi:hypothetical protein